MATAKMMIIPLEARRFRTEEVFRLDIELDKANRWEMCVSSMYINDANVGKHLLGQIGTLYCDALDVTRENPSQIITRLSRANNVIQHQEYHKLDTYNLEFIRLKLMGIRLGQLALTIIIREHGQGSQV